MSIKARLSVALILLGLSTVLVAASGLIALNSASDVTRSIVVTRVEPLRELKLISDAYAVNIVESMQKVGSGILTWQFGQSNILNAKGVIKFQWNAYLKNDLTPDEKKLADGVSAAMAKAGPVVDHLNDLLSTGDVASIADVAQHQLYPIIDPISSAISRLIDMQVKASEAQYQASLDGRMFSLAIMGAAGLVALLSLVFAVFVVFRGVSRPLRETQRTISRIAAGDLDTAVPYLKKKDEIGKIAAAIQVFLEKSQAIRDLDAASAARIATERERSAAMGTLVAALSHVVEAAVEGDFSRRIDTSFEDADLAGVATRVNDLVATVEQGVGEAGTVLSALAKTDLTQRMEGEHKGVFARLKADINAVTDTLSEIVGRLRSASGGVRLATGEILSGANDLADRTTRQAASIEQTSAAMEQLAQTVVDNAKMTEGASAMARSVAESAQGTGEVMRNATGAMERISASSSKISSIIGLIDDIAFQTNLLALNASVEAARAGEAGRGFAVVAVEVRRLAQSAAKASSDVKALIEQASSEVTGGTRLVSDASTRLLAMLDGVRENADQLLAIAQANREQSSAIAEVSAAIRHMDEMTQQNASLVEETNAAIEQTEGRATDLDRIVETFVTETAADETDEAERAAA
jgi:methyl-accepting chemotaxis protein